MSGQWLRVCSADEIKHEQASRASIGDRRFVVWRDGEGGVHVWDDACPHQGARLSLGSVRGGLIMCPAHGWRFDVNGQRIRPLTSAPACRSADDFATIFKAQERDGGIWVRIETSPRFL